MNKTWNAIAKDLWIALLDVLAVNIAYFLALIIRFYVNFEFRPTVSYYLTDWLRFTPFYTVLSIITFMLFKLYGGMWRYAGINDMNRIIGANLTTVAIQVVGTIVFIRRMPITYYVIGAILQFFFIVMIRFSYRILLVEKRKINNRKNPTISAMLIGAGETARKTIKHLEENTAFRITVVVDEKSEGKSLDGIPVVGKYEQNITDIKAIFIADPQLSDENREKIKQFAADKGLELQDYSGYLSNLGGRVPLTSLLELTNGLVIIHCEGRRTEFLSGKEALKSIKQQYEIERIDEVEVSLREPSELSYFGYDAWAKQHKEETGEEVSFF